MARRAERDDDEWVDGEYQVETIVRAKYVTKNRGWSYKIKWGGWVESRNEWKTETELIGCEGLLGRFWKEIGLSLRHEPYIPGTKHFKYRIMGREHEVVPSQRWINKEKALFQASIQEEQEATIAISVRKSGHDKRKRAAAMHGASRAIADQSVDRSSCAESVPGAQVRTPVKKPPTDRVAPSFSAPSPSSASSGTSSGSDSQSESPEDSESEYEVLTLPAIQRIGSPVVRYAHDDIEEDRNYETDSETEKGSVYEPSDSAPGSSGHFSDLSSSPASDDTDDERPVAPPHVFSDRSPLFTPAPDDPIASPPRTPSPVARSKERMPAPATVAHGPIRLLPVKGPYSSKNSTRNKVAQQYGLTITPHRPASRASTPEAPATPVGGSSWQTPSATADIWDENYISDMLVSSPNPGLYENPGITEAAGDILQDVADVEWGSSVTMSPAAAMLSGAAQAQAVPAVSTASVPYPELPLSASSLVSTLDAISVPSPIRDETNTDDSWCLTSSELAYPEDTPASPATMDPCEEYLQFPDVAQETWDGIAAHAPLPAPCEESVTEELQVPQALQAGESDGHALEPEDEEERPMERSPAIRPRSRATNISAVVSIPVITPVVGSGAMEVDDTERSTSERPSTSLVPVASARPATESTYRTSDGVWRGCVSIKLNGRVLVLGRVVCAIGAAPRDPNLTLNAYLDAQQAGLQLDVFRKSPEIQAFLATCGPVAHRGTIAAATAEDEPGMRLLVEFMRVTLQGAVLPLVSTKGDWIGHVIVYPTPRQHIGKTTGSSFVKIGPLSIKVCPWGRFLGHTPTLPHVNSAAANAPLCLDKSSFLGFAIKFFGLGHDFLNLLRQGGNRLRYHLPLDAQAYSSLPSNLIRFALDCCGGQETCAQAAHMIIAPCQGPLTLNDLPDNLAVVLRKPEARFYACPSAGASAEGAGLREIFVIGGIMTATPMALAEDVYLCTKRFEEAAAHPLWSAYVIPSILGMAMTLRYAGKNPVDVYSIDPKAFEFRLLIEAISEERCSFVTPTSSSSISDKTPPIYQGSLGAQGILLFALDEFRMVFEEIPEELWELKAKELLVRDIEDWRTLPGLLSIRHCCVMTHARDSALTSDTERVEWLTPSCEYSAYPFLEDTTFV